MKKRALLIAVLSLCTPLCACGQAPDPVNDAPEKLGISSGNYLNRGYLAQNEGDPFYYYLQYVTEGDRSQNGIYRVNSETGESTRLTEHIGFYLNLYDGYLYYQTIGDSDWRSLVWRVKCDGSSPPEQYYVTLYEITGGIMMANDMLFVVNTEGLCAAPLKDTGLTDSDMTVIAKECGNPVVLSDTLYYLHRKDRDNSYRSKPLDDLTASHEEVARIEYMHKVMAGYGYVYYLDSSNYQDYYRASLADGKIEKILTLQGNIMTPFNLYKGHLYYMEGGYIWHCDLDGSNLEKIEEKRWRDGLTEGEGKSFSWRLYIANDTVYVFNGDLSRPVYQVKI